MTHRWVQERLDRCQAPLDADTVDRWRKAKWCCDPRAFLPHACVDDPVEGLRIPTAAERVALMGLPRNYLAAALPSSLVKSQPALAEQVLGSLAGMTQQCEIVAALCSARAAAIGYVEKVLHVGELRTHREVFPDPLAVAKKLKIEGRGWTPQQALVAEHLRAADHRGSDVRLSSGTMLKPSCWPRMAADESLWKWKTALKTKWQSVAHINELELRAVLLSLKWRLRRASGQNKIALTLVDSAVSIGVLVKRRSSAYRLQRVVRKINALELVSGTRLVYGFVRSAVNPADAPSRDA